MTVDDRDPHARVDRRIWIMSGSSALLLVDPDFIVRVVEHYRDHPEHRAAIGTEEEHARLTTLLRRPPVDETAPAA